MKSLTHKLLAVTFIIALATGCASVTDAGLDTQPKQPTVEQTTDGQADSPGFGTDQSMDPHRRQTRITPDRFSPTTI
ncbi:MAG: hypothetical protein U5J63_15680 [Fodinibius sp.]|nr:hypothetical protein [Fodinibius sp.]